MVRPIKTIVQSYTLLLLGRETMTMATLLKESIQFGLEDNFRDLVYGFHGKKSDSMQAATVLE